jgi:hypothetical protein
MRASGTSQANIGKPAKSFDPELAIERAVVEKPQYVPQRALLTAIERHW